MLKKTRIPLSVLDTRLKAALLDRPWLIATRHVHSSRIQVEAVGRPVQWLAHRQVLMKVILDEAEAELRTVRVELSVHRDCKRHFILSGCVGLCIASVALPLILALAPSPHFLSLAWRVFLFPAAGLAVISYAVVVERTVTSRAKALEDGIWRVLKTGSATLSREEPAWPLMEDRNERDAESLRTTIGSGLALCLVLAVLLACLGGPWLSLFILGLLMPPLVAVERLEELSLSLPFRYRWRSYRALRCVSLYTFMLLPVLLIGIGSLPLLGPELAQFYPLLSLASYGLFFSSLHNGFTGLQERYGGIAENPTRGDENPVPPAHDAARFRAVGAMLFLVLGIGTGLAIVGLGITALAIVLASAVDGDMKGGCLRVFALAEAAGPLGVAIVASLGWALVGRVRRLALCPRRDRGGAELDAFTREGLFAEIKSELRATSLEVAFSRAAGQITGAAILEGGRGRFLLILEREALAIVREPRQREALVWHEVGHIRSAETMAASRRVLFNLWREHAARVLIDSLEQELRADRYAAARMGSPGALDGALATLTSIRQEPAVPVATQRWSFQMAVALLLGAPRVGYLHPDAGVRRQALSGPTPPSVVNGLGCKAAPSRVTSSQS